jgi:glycopeptide antibiotics resistance protein
LVAGKDRQLRKRDIAGIALLLYLAGLSLFVLFPRPILETGDPSQIAEYLRTHANFFYKILYADTHLVALGNFFMLTPFPIIVNAFSNAFSLRRIFVIGATLSALFELVQLAIPGRVSDPVDFFSNLISVGIGLLIVRFLRWRNPARTQ